MTDQNWQLKEGDQFAPATPDTLEHLPSHHCAAHLSDIEHPEQHARPDAPDCGACPGDGSICPSSCKVAEESPPVPQDIKSLLKLMAYRTHTTGPKTLAAHLIGAADYIEALERELAEASKDAELMEIVRSICCVADRASLQNNGEYAQLALCDASPLMIAARQACIDRGFTAGGLSIDAAMKEQA